MKSLFSTQNISSVVSLFYVASRFKSSTTKHNLYSLLSDMPKEVKHTAVLKKQRQKLKEKSQKYIPGIVTLQVLGSGANGAPRSLYVFTDQSRYLFNCGEGTQRLAHEHKMKLAKLEHIFFTHGSWENIGGLPGISLTIQDVGVPEITVHGPPGIVDIFSATRRFIVLKDLSVKTADYKDNGYFEDNVMKVTYVPLNVEVEHASKREAAVSLDRAGNRRGSCNSGENGSSFDKAESSCSDGITSDDETDYYIHERGGTKLPQLPQLKKTKKKKKRRSSSVATGEDQYMKRRRVESEGVIAMSYICKLHPRPGALNLGACVEKGVPPGPLLGRLKSGEDITLPDGRVVKSSDVTSPDDPGPVFIVVECPDERFLDPLEKEIGFSNHQSQAYPDDIAFLVVHFTPPSVVQNPRYKNWMDKFPQSTMHLMINEDSSCMGSIAVHRIQYKLNLLHPVVFPLLSDFGIPVAKSDISFESSDSSESAVSNSSVAAKESETSDCNSVGLTSSSGSSIYQAKTFSIVQLRPQKQLDSSNELMLNHDEYKKEVFEIEGMVDALEAFHESLRDVGVSDCSDDYNKGESQEYPSVVFLGTGSCIPNKTRNTSGILLNVSENHCMLMDCGEGTYGQLVRFHGTNKIGEVLSSMQAIFISHLHADHHIGLIGILKARRKFTKNSSSVLFLIAPKQIMTWLKYYNDHFEPILQQVEIIPNSDLVYNNATVSQAMMKRACDHLNLSNISTAGVKHCPNSFGIAVTHKSGWKITYSGDTMPCDSLVELGKGSSLLIHEATMEDELENEARIKMHSTTSEAIKIGKRMNAEFILLTHFSQRYATLPRFNDNIKDGVGIAFDNMKVRLSDLPKLPLMYPALQLMFSTHQDELEQKAYRRQMKQLRMANSRSPSASRSPSRSPKR